MDKTSASEYTKRKKVKILFREQYRMRHLILKDGRWHTISEVTCSENDITPKTKVAHWSEQARYERFQLSVDFCVWQHNFVVKYENMMISVKYLVKTKMIEMM